LLLVLSSRLEHAIGLAIALVFDDSTMNTLLFALCTRCCPSRKLFDDSAKPIVEPKRY
jgi:hypothetical protein